MSKINIFWFRRDLRLEDNAGLYRALKSGVPTLCLFIFDQNILDHLENKKDLRVDFLHNTLTDLKASLQALNSDLVVEYGKPNEIWSKLTTTFDIENVYTNHDFEPYALTRDAQMKTFFESKNIGFKTYKDHVIFEKGEVLKDDGKPYTVFTPYSRKWKTKLESRQSKWIDENGIEQQTSYYFKPYPNEKYFHNLLNINELKNKYEFNMPSLESMGFQKTTPVLPGKTVSMGLIKKYDETRNFPAILGTSRLGIHFRFGTISIREKARKGQLLNEIFLSELIWRDFYAQIMAEFPHVIKGAFRPEYESIAWRNDEADFKKWCEGKTGYPLVDAGMRELNHTGYMHNRVRMVVASFLTKHLLIDWRWGEAYFAQKLIDFDLASNNGGWQWAAGCGTDAAPYFRVFNPEEQLKKFDKDATYVKKWVPEFGTFNYAKPMVDHKMARERCLVVYKAGIELGRNS